MTSMGHGLPTLEEAFTELSTMSDALRHYYADDYLAEGIIIPMGNMMDLLEIASAFLARAYDIERRLYQREQVLSLPRGCPEQRFRTGALESFISMAKVLKELGSRRISAAQLRHDNEKTGHDQ